MVLAVCGSNVKRREASEGAAEGCAGRSSHFLWDQPGLQLPGASGLVTLTHRMAVLMLRLHPLKLPSKTRRSRPSALAWLPGAEPQHVRGKGAQSYFSFWASRLSPLPASRRRPDPSFPVAPAAEDRRKPLSASLAASVGVCRVRAGLRPQASLGSDAGPSAQPEMPPETRRQASGDGFSRFLNCGENPGQGPCGLISLLKSLLCELRFEHQNRPCEDIWVLLQNARWRWGCLCYLMSVI